jgi:hypothetical protein
MAQLSREEMLNLIRKRESVLYDGRVISSVDELPSEAELAKGDADKEAAAKKSLLAQKAVLETQLAMLSEVDKVNAEAKAKSENKSEAKSSVKSEVKASAKETKEVKPKQQYGPNIFESEHDALAHLNKSE